MTRRAVAAGCVGAALLLLMAGCPRRAPAPPPGPPLDLVLPSLDGGSIVVGALRGRVVVLHFFATWSLASQLDVEEIREVLENAPPRSVAVVGVGLDADGAALVQAWREALDVGWPLAVDAEVVAQGAGPLRPVLVAPTTVVLDASGRVAWRHEGGLPPGRLAQVVGGLVGDRAVP